MSPDRCRLVAMEEAAMGLGAATVLRVHEDWWEVDFSENEFDPMQFSDSVCGFPTHVEFSSLPGQYYAVSIVGGELEYMWGKNGSTITMYVSNYTETMPYQSSYGYPPYMGNDFTPTPQVGDIITFYSVPLFQQQGVLLATVELVNPGYLGIGQSVFWRQSQYDVEWWNDSRAPHFVTTGGVIYRNAYREFNGFTFREADTGHSDALWGMTIQRVCQTHPYTATAGLFQDNSYESYPAWVAWAEASASFHHPDGVYGELLVGQTAQLWRNYPSIQGV